MRLDFHQRARPRELPVGAPEQRPERVRPDEGRLVEPPFARDDVVRFFPVFVVRPVVRLVRAHHRVATEVDAVVVPRALEHQVLAVRRLARELGEEREPARLEEVQPRARAGQADVRVRHDGHGELAGKLLADVLHERGRQVLAEDIHRARLRWRRRRADAAVRRRKRRVEPRAVVRLRSGDVSCFLKFVPQEESLRERGDDGHVQKQHLELLRAQRRGGRGEVRLEAFALGGFDSLETRLRRGASQVSLLLAPALLFLRVLLAEKRAERVDGLLRGRPGGLRGRRRRSGVLRSLRASAEPPPRASLNRISAGAFGRERARAGGGARNGRAGHAVSASSMRRSGRDVRRGEHGRRHRTQSARSRECRSLDGRFKRRAET